MTIMFMHAYDDILMIKNIPRIVVLGKYSIPIYLASKSKVVFKWKFYVGFSIKKLYTSPFLFKYSLTFSFVRYFF